MPQTIYHTIITGYDKAAFQTNFKTAFDSFQDNDFDEAFTLTQTIIESGKSEFDNTVLALLYDFLGQCTEKNGDSLDALRYYKLAVQTDKNCSSAWHNMGLVYLVEKKKLCPALDPTTDFLDSVAPLHTAYLYLSQALTIAVNNGEDINCYFFLHSMASFHEKYATKLAKYSPVEMENIKDYYQNAINCYQQAIEKCPSDRAEREIYINNYSECLALFARFFYRSSQFKEAKKYYQETLKHNPNHPTATNQLGMIAFKEGRFALAVNYFQQLLKIEKDEPALSDAWLNIACCHRSEKQFEKAQEALDKARKYAKDPNDEWIENEAQNLSDAIKENSPPETGPSIFP